MDIKVRVSVWCYEKEQEVKLEDGMVLERDLSTKTILKHVYKNATEDMIVYFKEVMNNTDLMEEMEDDIKQQLLLKVLEVEELTEEDNYGINIEFDFMGGN